MHSLPFRPQAIDIGVMSPKDRIAGRRARGKVVQQVVNVFERSKEVIARRAAGEAKEVCDLKNSINVFRRWIRLKDNVLVSTGPTISMPQRIHAFESG